MKTMNKKVYTWIGSDIILGSKIIEKGTTV